MLEEHQLKPLNAYEVCSPHYKYVVTGKPLQPVHLQDLSNCAKSELALSHTEPLKGDEKMTVFMLFVGWSLFMALVGFGLGAAHKAVRR